jgi:hypothetical protein
VRSGVSLGVWVVFAEEQPISHAVITVVSPQLVGAFTGDDGPEETALTRLSPHSRLFSRFKPGIGKRMESPLILAAPAARIRRPMAFDPRQAAKRSPPAPRPRQYLTHERSDLGRARRIHDPLLIRCIASRVVGPSVEKRLHDQPTHHCSNCVTVTIL